MMQGNKVVKCSVTVILGVSGADGTTRSFYPGKEICRSFSENDMQKDQSLI